MNNLAANAEIRVRSVNGKPAYALTNDKGEAKFCFKCGFCKKTHQVWLAARMSEQYKQIVVTRGWEYVVLTHVRACPDAQALITEWNKIAPTKLEENLLRRITTYSNYYPVLFNWVDRGDGGHKCSAKCQSACGQKCECRCRGRNHGGR